MKKVSCAPGKFLKSNFDQDVKDWINVERTINDLFKGNIQNYRVDRVLLATQLLS